MWLFTQHGMISVVAHREDEDLVLIRARDKEQLQAILDLAGKKHVQIKTTPTGDYEFRAIVDREILRDIMVDLAYDIDYGNFKNQCDARKDKRYAKLLHEVWLTVYARLAGNKRSLAPWEKTGKQANVRLGNPDRREMQHYFDEMDRHGSQ